MLSSSFLLQVTLLASLCTKCSKCSRCSMVLSCIIPCCSAVEEKKSCPCVRVMVEASHLEAVVPSSAEPVVAPASGGVEVIGQGCNAGGDGSERGKGEGRGRVREAEGVCAHGKQRKWRGADQSIKQS